MFKNINSIKIYCHIHYNLGIITPNYNLSRQSDYPLLDDECHQKALEFIKSVVMHRDVVITVSSCNKNGSMIGAMFIDDTNLSVALVKEGLAKVHKSAERFEYTNQLREAEKSAKNQKINVIRITWHEY